MSYFLKIQKKYRKNKKKQFKDIVFFYYGYQEKSHISLQPLTKTTFYKKGSSKTKCFDNLMVK